MNNELSAALEAKRIATANLRTVLAEVQRNCTHEDLAECEYQKMEYGNSMPPMRVCCTCGMTEEGWGSGYIVLTRAALYVSRDALYARRMGLAIQNHHKGPLLRHETTVQEMIDGEVQRGTFS